MCYEVQCSTCGKTTWGGCGRHVPSVYQRIPSGQHCQCKGWPGVKTGGESNSGSGDGAGVGAEQAKAPSSCSIL